MAQEIRRFAVTIPAGTAITSPTTTSLNLTTRVVDEVQIRVPPGPRGEVGFALALAGQPIIPYNPGEWIVTDDELIPWPLDGYPDSGAWQLIAYNTGRYPHTIEIRFLVEVPGEGGGAAAAVATPSLVGLTG